MLAAITLSAALAPMATPIPASAAGECGIYASETAPPPTIRVYRTATGAVDTVDFGTYVKNVLSREWISSWTTESLRAGALAVKNYAWYQVIHWRGYLNAAGQCFDVFDSTRDQHYDPSRPTYASMAAAVDATWGTLAHRSGRIFATYYNAGQAYEACGARANGWQMFQWGTQACGLDGRGAAEIMAIYYPGVVVSAAPAPVTPAPTPAQTPAPTPVPAPVPAPVPTPAPTTPPSAGAPTDQPTPTPTPPPPPPAPTPVPAPPPPPQMPGGGQVGLSAPPPAPPPDPEPIVVAVTAGPVVAVAPEPEPSPARTLPADHRVLEFERQADAARIRDVAGEPATASVSTRWFNLRVMVQRLMASIVDRWSVAFLGQQPAGDQLGRGEVLDREPHRLEDGDRVRVAELRPLAPDATDLHELFLRQ